MFRRAWPLGGLSPRRKCCKTLFAIGRKRRISSFFLLFVTTQVPVKDTIAQRIQATAGGYHTVKQK